MKHLFVFLFLAFNTVLFAQYEKNQLLFKFTNDQINHELSVENGIIKSSHYTEFFDELVAKYSIQSINCPFKTKDPIIQNTFLIQVDDKYVDELIRYIEKRSFIEYAERIPSMELFLTPNDPLYNQQYNLAITNADLAWDLSLCPNGANQTVVAIIDDAVLTSHPDLAPTIWNNPNEVPGNGIDDDNNGYIDDVVGWDAANNDNDPNPPINATSSYFSHGTHVAGITGAATDNNIGIASIGFGLQLMSIKIGNSNTGGSLTGALAGVDYAVASGYVDIANMSWGGAPYSQTFQNLFTIGYNQGITWIAAAGNSNSPAPMYPASYQHVISVAATNSSDAKASFSNYGTTIDVSAPGVAILSTVPGANPLYDFKSGTSMAAPYVAGLAGLMKCFNSSASPTQIETCLKTTADNIDPQNPSFVNQLGAGRVNAEAALQCLSITPISDFESTILNICPNENIQFSDLTSGIGPFTYSWNFPGGIPTTSTQQNPIVSYPAAGTYTVSLTASNVFGNDTETKTNYINVAIPTAILSGNATILQGGIAFLRVDFTGNPPYDFVYTDGSNNFSVNNIQNNPYYIQVSPSDSTTYSLVSFNDNGCNGMISGSGQVDVLLQSASSSCSSLMQKIINNNDQTERISICSVNNGYVIAGNTNAFGQGNFDVFVNRYDSNDNLVWSKTIGSSNSEFSSSVIVDELDNGNLIIGFESNAFNGGGSSGVLSLVCLNSLGNIIWQKRINTNIGDAQAKDIMVTNSGFTIVGSKRGFSSGTAYDSYILKFDNNGNQLNSLTINGPGNEHADGVLVSSSNENVIVGSSSTVGVNTAGTVLKLNSSLNSIFFNAYDIGAGFEQLKTVKERNGSYFMYGNTGTPSVFDLWLLKTDLNGVVENSFVISGPNEERATELEILANGNILISGYTNSFGHGNYDLFVSLFDNNGNEIWTKLYGSIQADQAHPLDNNLIINENQGIGYLIGNTQSFGGSDKDAFIIKFSLDSDTLCNEIVGQFWNVSSIAPSVQTVNFPLGTLPNSVNANFVDAVMPVVEDTLCEINCLTTFASNCLVFDTVQKISDIAGNFLGTLTNEDRFGQGFENIGDLNGDGINDFAISATQDDDAGNNKGAVYICFMNSDGTVNTHQKIYSGNNGFSGITENNGVFGNDIAVIGDLNNDGIQDLAVGEPHAESLSGAVWILFMNANGTVQSSQKISRTNGNLGVTLANQQRFGQSIAPLGDLNNDGVLDIIVGCTELITNTGNLYVLFMNANGTVNSVQEIRQGVGGFTGSLGFGDAFGHSVDVLSDLNGDGIIDLAVGARGDDDGGTDKGAVWLLYLQTNGTVIGHSKINDLTTGFNTLLDNDDRFGIGLSNLGDIDQNGIDDLLVGATGDDDGGSNHGAAYILMLETNLTIKDYFKISDNTIGFSNYLSSSDGFGWNMTNTNDLNNDGHLDIAISAGTDDDGGTNRGAVYVIFFDDTCSTTPPISVNCPPSTNIDTFLCLGDSIQLNASGDTSIFWQSTYRISNPLIKNPFVFPDHDTTYIVSSVDSNGCTYIDTFNVQVYPLPQLSTNPDSALICPSQNVNIQSSGASQYNWSPTFGLSNPTIANPIASPSTTTTYYLTASDMNNCSSQDSVYIEVLTCCGALAQIEASDTTICVNESIIFTNQSISGNNPNWEWNFGANATPSSFNGQNPPSILFNTPGIYNVQLILTDDCGTDTAFLDIFVNDLPIFNVANDTIICDQDSLLYNLGDIEIIGYDYLWTPNLNLDDNTIANPEATIFNDITYYVQVTDQFTSCVAYDSVRISMINPTYPLIDISQSFCLGDSVSLYVNVDYDSLTWGNGLVMDTFGFLPTNDTLVSVIVYDSICMFEDSINIELDTIPTYSSTYEDSVCEGSNITIVINGTSQVYWENGDTINSLQTTINQDTIIYYTIFNGACELIDSAVIWAFPPPNDAINGPDTICVNSTVSLWTNGLYEYVWSSGENNDTADYLITQDTTVYVDISSTECSISDSLTIIAMDSVTLTLTGDSLICEGDSFTIQAITNATNVLWQDGSTSLLQNGVLLTDSTFFVSASNGYCPPVSTSITIQLDSLPEINVLSPIEGYYEEQVTPTIDGQANNWSWTPPAGLSCTDCQYPTITIDSSIVYYIQAYNNVCLAQDTLEVFMIQLDGCYILPTAFSPNQDNVNDTYYPIGLPNGKSEILEFKIYNRWGELLHNKIAPWDGTYKNKAVPLDVYIFYLKTDCQNEIKVESGNFTLIR